MGGDDDLDGNSFGRMVDFRQFRWHSRCFEKPTMKKKTKPCCELSDLAKRFRAEIENCDANEPEHCAVHGWAVPFLIEMEGMVGQ